MDETAVSRYFSSDEIVRLERGLPRLAGLSAKLLVPFTAYRLRSAEVAWINRRWFLERGFNLGEEAIRRKITAWLIDEFAWLVRADGDAFTGDTRRLWADRYGSSDGSSPHGGSGRVATAGCFQAKGIGQTPLVGHGAPPGHSHGCLSVTEGLREAIWGEIAAAEFPHGAIPVIAVLDTGMGFSSPNPEDRYEQNVRRGILVRPAVVRPAHAERAPLFKHPIGDFLNSQSEDVRRTQDMIVNWAMASQDSGSAAEKETLSRCFRAIGEQIAFGQVHRLFAGGHFSSNLSIRGELLDFGNMHALPNWARAQVHSMVAGFGDEIRLLRPLIASLAFHFTKYQRRGDAVRLGAELFTLATNAYERAWREYSVSLFQAESLELEVRDLLHEVLRQYFAGQQRHRLKYRFGLATQQGVLPEPAWLHDAVIDEKYPLDTVEYRALSKIVAQVRDNKSPLYVALTTAARLLMPRPSVERRLLLESLARAVPQAGAGQTLDTKSVEQLVQDAVGGARRRWPRLPMGYAVLAHTVHEGSSALLCAQRRDGPRTAWLEGICGSSADLYWFDHRLQESNLIGTKLRRDGHYWWATFPARHGGDGIWHAQLHDAELPLPRLEVWYPEPASRWMELEGPAAGL